jgi:hypothetical protein
MCVGAVALTSTVVLAAQTKSKPPRFVAAPNSPIRVGSPSGVITGDLNRDGRPDLVAAVGGTSALSVLLGDGRGGFSPAPGSPLPVAPAPHLVEIGDLDRDGKPDLVATSHDSYGVFVWLGDGTGRFRSAAGSPYPALAGESPTTTGSPSATSTATIFSTSRPQTTKHTSSQCCSATAEKNSVQRRNPPSASAANLIRSRSRT